VKNTEAGNDTDCVAVSVPVDDDDIPAVKLATTALVNVPEPESAALTDVVIESSCPDKVPEPESPDDTVIAGVTPEPTSVPEPDSAPERLNATVTAGDKVPELDSVPVAEAVIARVDDNVPTPVRLAVWLAPGVRVGTVSVPDPERFDVTLNAGVRLEVSVPEPDNEAEASKSWDALNVRVGSVTTAVSVES
jgi:hypothetical protein